MSEAFAKLHPKIQEAIWNQRWDELRPLQVDAIEAILGSEDHVILAAATASGKTEAVFLPVLSKIVSAPVDSIQALYISPLKALINDQFRRLEDLCQYADIPVHRWHGDVNASEKRNLRKEPSGVLLITPESLESQFINYDRDIPRMYAFLRFIVIDELHAFLDGVRGMHLQSLLARLRIARDGNPRFFGLSATIGDFEPAKVFICPTDTASVRVIEDPSQQKDLRVGLKAYYDGEEKNDQSEDAKVPDDPKMGLWAIASDVAKRFKTESNLIFCNSRRQTELLADKINQIARTENWPRNPFMLHHGSLSRELREDTETELKSGHPVTAICTSTLEMGIDIGSVKTIGQVGPTWSVASLVQRLGRSGRKDGETQTLRMYTLDELPNQNSSLTRRLHTELVRAIALLELHRAKWLEPPNFERFHFSTCVHQIFSVLRQTGGAAAVRLFDVLCKRGAFRRITSAQFGELLRGLAQKQLIEQVPTGDLILAPLGERIVESRDFYAAFASRIEFRVEHRGEQIGVLAEDCIPPVGEFLLFGGRRWFVEQIDKGAKCVQVIPARGWKPPRFNGDFGGLHAIVMTQMKRVLSEVSVYPYLNHDSELLLDRARKAFAFSGLASSDCLNSIDSIQWFPWAGSNVHTTLELCAKVDGLDVTSDGFCLYYRKCNTQDFLNHRRRIADGKFKSDELVSKHIHIERDRFDEFVPRDLLETAYAEESLDLNGAARAASNASTIKALQVSGMDESKSSPPVPNPGK